MIGNVHTMVGLMIPMINIDMSSAILHRLIRLSLFSMVELMFLLLFNL